jgi:hypothetical protein
MAANSVILLPSNSHDNTSNPSTLVGERSKGAGFYGMGDGFHTVQIQLTNFIGTVKIQGSLATTPGDDDWLDVRISPQGGAYSVDTTGLASKIGTITEVTYTSATTINKTYNFTGNFVWIRAEVTNWTAGNVNRILLNF